MALPISICPRDTVQLPSGGTVEVRGLSRAEAVQIRSMSPDVEAMEIFSLEKGCEVSAEDARSWWTNGRNDDVEKTVDTIYRLSGLTEDTGKDGAEDSPSAKST